VLEFRGIVTGANTIFGEQIMVSTGAKATVTLQKTTLPGK